MRRRRLNHRGRRRRTRNGLTKRFNHRQSSRECQGLSQSVERADHAVIGIMLRSSWRVVFRRDGVTCMPMVVTTICAAVAGRVVMSMSARSPKVERIAGNHHREIGEGRNNGCRLSGRFAHHQYRGDCHTIVSSDPTSQNALSMHRPLGRVKQEPGVFDKCLLHRPTAAVTVKAAPQSFAARRSPQCRGSRAARFVRADHWTRIDGSGRRLRRRGPACAV